MRQIHSWEGGMDQDTSKRLYPKNKYYSAKNVRIISAQKLADGGIQTMYGNDSFVSLPSEYSDHKIIGWGKVGKWTILFSTKNTGTDLQGDKIYPGTCENKYKGDYYSFTLDLGKDMTRFISKGEVYLIRVDNGNKYKFEVFDFSSNGVKVEFLFYDYSTSVKDYIYSNITVDNYYQLFAPNVFEDAIWKIDLSDDTSLEKIYEGKLTLTQSYPIYNEVVGYYVNKDIQKIYWADNFNFVRNLNVVDPDLNSLTPGRLDVVPDAELFRPYLYGISGGNLPVGVVQYSYQLYRNDGSITNFSPVSGLIHLTKSSEKDDSDRNYQGSNELDEEGNTNYSGKSVTIEIKNIDLTYDNIRVVNILYRKLYEEPTINIIADYSIGQDSLRITDDGEINQGTVSLNLFRSLGGSLFSAKTLTNKDNILFAGNINESFFDVDELAEPLYVIDVTPSSLEFTHNSTATKTVDVYTNDYDYIIYSVESSWIKTNYVDSQTLEVSVKENTDPTSRSANIILAHSKNIERTATIDVTQNPAYYINAETNYHETDSHGETITITIDAGDYDYVIDTVSDTWITANHIDPNTLEIIIDDNTAESSRDGYVIVAHNQDSSKTDKITIEQTGIYVSVPASPISFGGLSDTKQYNVFTDGWDYNIDSVSDSWITATKVNSGLIEISVTKNDTGASRSGTISLSHSQNGTVTETIDVNQDSTDAHELTVEPNEKEILADGGSFFLDIYCTYQTDDWTAEITSGDSYITLKTTSGTGDTTIEVIVDENTTGVDRYGNINVSLDDYSTTSAEDDCFITSKG